MDKYLILSRSEWGALYSNKKFKRAAYICLFVGYVLCIINDGLDLFSGNISIKSIFAIMVFAILTVVAFGIYAEKVITIPFSVLSFDAVYIVINIYATMYLRHPINEVTLCYSVMYFIINSLIFRLRYVFYLNLVIFSVVTFCAMLSIYVEDIASASASQPRLVNSIILSAAAFLLQHLVLTVRAMLIEQLGSIRLKMASLEAEFEIEKAKKEARDRAVQLNRISIIEALGASIAHEINQPVAAALTYSKAARNWAKIECQAATETLRALNGVEINVNRAARLVENIRLLTTNKGRKYSKTNIVDLVNDQVSLIRDEFERRGLRIIIDSPDIQCWAVVCASEVALATINLLRNAMEAFDEPAPDSLVSVRVCQTSAEWFEIVVVDNGRGLSPDGIVTAFAAFQTTKPTGAGIGLSICQEVAEHHSGSVSLERNLSGGVTATLRLATHSEHS